MNPESQPSVWREVCGRTVDTLRRSAETAFDAVFRWVPAGESRWFKRVRIKVLRFIRGPGRETLDKALHLVPAGESLWLKRVRVWTLRVWAIAVDAVLRLIPTSEPRWLKRIRTSTVDAVRRGAAAVFWAVRCVLPRSEPAWCRAIRIWFIEALRRIGKAVLAVVRRVLPESEPRWCHDLRMRLAVVLQPMTRRVSAVVRRVTPERAPWWWIEIKGWTVDVLRRWWRDATGPLDDPQYYSLGHALRRKVFLWSPVVVLVVMLVGALGLYSFTGWRARDLASKAVASAAEGNFHLAFVQVTSAQTLRQGDIEVRKARALVESHARVSDAPQTWEELPSGLVLTSDELLVKADVMTAFGSEEQFDAVIHELESAGLSGTAAEMRARRLQARGDLKRALEEAREAARSGEPEHRLKLLRLLAMRYGPQFQLAQRPELAEPAVHREMTGLIDALVDTQLAGDALAVGLNNMRPWREKALAWARMAWKDLSPSNPALLPAATALVLHGEEKPEELGHELQAAYAEAPVANRAELAAWLLRHGLTPSILDLLSHSDAARHPMAFAIRTEALVQEERWSDLLTQAEAASVAPLPMRLLARARADRELGREAMAQKTLQDAIRVAAEDNLLPQTMNMADMIGATALADAELLRLCSDPITAEQAFRQARDRFARRGQFAELEDAFHRAATAAPSAPSVTDYGRYRNLIMNRPVDLEETAAAVGQLPRDVNRRVTHALALLQAGDPVAARNVFDDLDVFLEALPPGQQAVLLAVLGRTGDPLTARLGAQRLDMALLKPGESELIREWRLPPQQKAR